MFKAIFTAIANLFNMVTTISTAANRLANVANMYAAEIEANAAIECLPALAKARTTAQELGINLADLDAPQTALPPPVVPAPTTTTTTK